jgi:hypothetical protein
MSFDKMQWHDSDIIQLFLAFVKLGVKIKLLDFFEKSAIVNTINKGPCLIDRPVSF